MNTRDVQRVSGWAQPRPGRVPGSIFQFYVYFWLVSSIWGPSFPDKPLVR